MPDISEKENEMQRAGKGSNSSSDCLVGRMVRGGVWSEDYALEFAPHSHTNNTPGHLWSDLFAHRLLSAHHMPPHH